MNKLLIDTNIYSHALRGTPEVVSTLRRVSSIGFSAISIGELLSGFKAGNRENENRRELDEFLDSPRVKLLVIDEITAEYYSAVIHQLKKKGAPIPTNDIWIAAVAFQHGLPLYSLNNHFLQVAGLLRWK
jgi:predicted nucleic acid-binding protein